MKPIDQMNFDFGSPLTYYSIFFLLKTIANIHTLPIKAYSLPLIDYKISRYPDWELLLKIWNTFQTRGQLHKNHSLITTKVILPSCITTLFITYMDLIGTTFNITHIELSLWIKDFSMFSPNSIIRPKALFVHVIWTQCLKSPIFAFGIRTYNCPFTYKLLCLTTSRYEFFNSHEIVV